MKCRATEHWVHVSVRENTTIEQYHLMMTYDVETSGSFISYQIKINIY
jgi:hypothetical protein